MDHLTVFTKVVEAAEGLTNLAESLGLPIQTVSNWRYRGIPPNRCKAIEAKYGIPVHRLRPNDWRDFWPDDEPVTAGSVQR